MNSGYLESPPPTKIIVKTKSCQMLLVSINFNIKECSLATFINTLACIVSYI